MPCQQCVVSLELLFGIWRIKSKMSRVYRIGNIFSRIEGLIRKGHINESDRPLWYDVYRRFPPKYEPNAMRKAPEVKVKEIFYEEDRLRALVHKKFEEQLNFNLLHGDESQSQQLIKACQEYISKGMSEDEAIKQLKNSQFSSAL